MKKTIVVADRDGSLQHAFMTVFSRDHFEIVYASTGKEVEKIAERMRPDVYIVNVDLPKTNGIEVYKKLQKQRLLDTASFFFLKDESDKTELLGYQADGIIEKPLNFFKVYETITQEEEIIELTDLIDERTEFHQEPRSKRSEVRVEEDPTFAPSVFTEESDMGVKFTDTEAETAAPRKTGSEEAEPYDREEGSLEPSFEDRLKDAMDGLVGSAVNARDGLVGNAVIAKAEGSAVEEADDSQKLEAQFKVVLNQAMQEAALKLSARLAPILTQYVEDYVKRMLLDTAEKVIKDEIDKLLKESAG
jgi:DNA-binding NarL/FixJ family response regulator